MVRTLSVSTSRQGLHEITREVEALVSQAAGSGAIADDGSGICTLFLRHTSASLLIQENADPSARFDLERWLDRLVPESGPGASGFTHTSEGPDDMPSHIKAALTGTSLSIPVINGRLALGTWQGIYLWEHRSSPHNRQIAVHIGP
jgi:secondary thiamine-phosphate synthase enzyme